MTIHFLNEFREIYKNKSVNKKSQKESFLQTYANNLIRNWQKKYYNYGINGLISTRVKNKSPRKSKNNIELTIFRKISAGFIKK
ncbi:hypothetical protein [Mesomycoplasma dispar]|uniref:hypothetical protein n=1 Tax=Mesomycoplasma dispar TaxID=86660 RepID=UPI0018E0AAE0|nr:hypothetical protein [Mesomycoplasma dispar]